MKFFVSITIPNILAERLDTILPESNVWRKSNPDQFHITLRYIGKASRPGVDRIRKELRGVGFSPFQLTLKEIGVFPETGVSRVIWLGVEHSEPLIGLAGEIDKAIYPVLQTERDKPFSPHMTLARVRKSAKRKPNVKPRIPEMDDSVTFTVDSFQLMRSEQSAKGVVHYTVENYSLSQS